MVVQAVGRVDPDGSRYLLGDTLGNLHMLVLSHDSQRVVGLKLEALGRISAPSSLSYLDSGVVFVVCRLIVFHDKHWSHLLRVCLPLDVAGLGAKHLICHHRLPLKPS